MHDSLLLLLYGRLRLLNGRLLLSQLLCRQLLELQRQLLRRAGRGLLKGLLLLLLPQLLRRTGRDCLGMHPIRQPSLAGQAGPWLGPRRQERQPLCVPSLRDCVRHPHAKLSLFLLLYLLSRLQQQQKFVQQRVQPLVGLLFQLSLIHI